MNTYQLTPQQAKTCISCLKLKAGRKRQSMRNMERRKDIIIEAVGEKEFIHRLSLREKDATKSELLVSDLSAFVDAEVVI